MGLRYFGYSFRRSTAIVHELTFLCMMPTENCVNAGLPAAVSP